MKKLVLIFILFMSINLVFADIIIKDFEKKEFKVGEKIFSSLNVKAEDESFLSASINCDLSSLNFYKTPLTKNTNYLEIPPIIANKNFIGKCRFEFKVTDINDKTIEKAESEEIEIENKIDLDFTTDKETYNPGENIIIKIKSEKGSKITVILIDEAEIIEQSEELIYADISSKTIKLLDTIKSGKKKITLKAEDKYGNSAEIQKEISISQVPKSIKLVIETKEINPDEEVVFKADVFDQSEIKMNLEISYRIFDSNNVLNSLTSSDKNFVKLENPAPGEYLIKSIYKNLEDSDKFSVKEFRKINLSTEDGIITVENRGNVRYIEELVIETKLEEITYHIPLSLDLKVNEKVFIDLKNELPSNNYDFSLKSKNQSYILNGIEVRDNRPVVKKLSQSLSQITGSSIIETSEVSNIFYLSFFLFFLGFIIIFIVNKRFKTKITKVVDDTVIVQGKQNKGLKKSLDKEMKEKNIIKEMFGSYVDHKILNKDFKSDIVKKEISILFTDIRGFSKMFDTKDSEKVAEMLNLYFSKSSEIIKKNRGFVNKFIGDSVMALFNATSNDENHLINSIKTGLEIKKEMSYLNLRLKEKGIEPIEVGIGIDSGTCAVGNVGSKEKLEFTAVGSPVNIAFRLQSLSESSILITERIYRKIESRIKVEYFGEYEMKNITGKIKIYKVLDIK